MIAQAPPAWERLAEPSGPTHEGDDVKNFPSRYPDFPVKHWSPAFPDPVGRLARAAGHQQWSSELFWAPLLVPSSSFALPRSSRFPLGRILRLASHRTSKPSPFAAPRTIRYDSGTLFEYLLG